MLPRKKRTLILLVRSFVCWPVRWPVRWKTTDDTPPPRCVQRFSHRPLGVACICISGSLSFQKRYYDSVKKQIFPFLTAVIDVKDGIVMGVAWDDASIFCGLSKVERNTLDFQGLAGDEKRFEQPVDACYYTQEECTAKSESCDLLLHVVWTGTDAKGRSFLSSSYRYSSFPPQEWGDRLVGILPDVKN